MSCWHCGSFWSLTQVVTEWQDLTLLSCEHTERQRQTSIVPLDAWVNAWEWSGWGVDFQVSQCIPMDPDTWVDADVAANAVGMPLL